MNIPTPTPPPRRPLPAPAPVAVIDAPMPLTVAVDVRRQFDRVAWALSASNGTNAAGILPDGATPADARIDATKALLTLPDLAGQPIDLICPDEHLWSALDDLAPTFPNLTLLPRTRQHVSTALATRARTAARELLSTTEQAAASRERASTPTTVATDGSYGRGTHAGWGWVGQDGRHNLGVVPATYVLPGELAAIRSVLETYGPTIALHIQSDSRDALAVVARAAAAEDGQLSSVGLVKEVNRQASHIARLLAHRQGPVTFEWVRAHAGHALNEGADRLAVLARRTHEASAPAHRSTLAADIAAQTLRAVPA